MPYAILQFISGFLMGASVVLLLLALWQRYKHFILSPSNHRQWTKDQETLQGATFDASGKTVTIHNVRDSLYAPETNGEEYDVRHYDDTYNLDDVERLWFIESVFGPLAAHVFFSFEFKDGRCLPISIEIRKRKDVVFGWKILFRPVELMYIAATEADVLRTRICDRTGEAVSIFEMRVPKKYIRAVLVDMLTRMDELRERPVFYDLIAENCTSLPLWHLRRVWKESKLPLWHHSYLFTAHASQLLKAVGLVGEPLPYDRKKVCPVPREDFSRALRVQNPLSTT